MKDLKELKELKNINFDVYNTLNLMDPILGDCYLSEGYNPLGNEYRMKKDLICKIVNNATQEDPSIDADFLNYDNNTVIKHFQNSLKNSAELQGMLEKDKTKAKDPKTLQNLNEGIIYLKNRQKMLEIFCRDLKNPNANSIETFKKLANLNKKYAKLLEESFSEKAKMEILHQNFLVLCLSVENTQQKTNKIKMEKARDVKKSILKQKDMTLKNQKTKLKEEAQKLQKEQERQKELQDKAKELNSAQSKLDEAQQSVNKAFNEFVGKEKDDMEM